MDRRSSAIYLDLKGLSVRAIHEDIVTTLGADAMAYSTVTCYLRETRFFPSADRIASGPIPEMPDDADEAILSAFAEMPFASVRQLAQFTHLSPATVSRRLTQSLGFTVRHFRWVSHLLSDAQKLERVQ
jgi:AraC-like DNA-binding protein